MSRRSSVRSLSLLSAVLLVALGVVGPAPALTTGPDATVIRAPGTDPGRATPVAPDGSVRSILDPNLGAHWYAVHLDAGDTLVVQEVYGPDAALEVSTGPWDGAATMPELVAPGTGGVFAADPGTYLVRYGEGSVAPPDWYELRFEVVPSGLTSTPPPAGVPVCGDARLAAGPPGIPPGLTVCPGALVTSVLTDEDPVQVFAMDVAWGDTIVVSKVAGPVVVEGAYPGTGPAEWFALPPRQLAAVEGSWRFRVRLAEGAPASAYTVRFDVEPVAAAGERVMDVELAAGCSIRGPSGTPLMTDVPGDEPILLRVTNTAPYPQGLSIGDAEQGAPVDDVVVPPFLGIAAAREWVPRWYPGGTTALCTSADGTPLADIRLEVDSAMRSVPPLEGLPVTEAVEVLLALGLVPRTRQVWDPVHPRGAVVSTDPAPGSTVAGGSSVTVRVSIGPAPSPTPTASPAPPGPEVDPDRTLPPGRTIWPDTVIDAAIALAAADDGFRAASTDWQTAGEAQDMDLLLSAATAMTELADGSVAQAQRLADLPELATVGRDLLDAFASIGVAGRQVNDTALAGDAPGFEAAVRDLGRGMAAYVIAREPLLDAAELAVIMRRERAVVPPVTTTASPRAPGPVAFVCDRVTAVRDPLDRSWTVNGIYWAERADYDRLTIRLLPDGDAPATTRVSVRSVDPADLAALGLPVPAEGGVATIVRFSEGVTLQRALEGIPDKPAVRTVAALTAPSGRVTVVLGVSGRGCVSLQAPAWADPSTQDTAFVDITIDVEHDPS